MEGFEASDITEITGVKRPRLQQWLERGFIHPSIQKAEGHGSRNVYNRYDLYRIGIFKKLVESGLSRKLVASYLNATIPFILGSSGYCMFFRDGEKITCFMTSLDSNLRSSEERYYEMSGSKNYDDILVINFGAICGQIDQKIENLPK
jgi:hypothetical protein